MDEGILRLCTAINSDPDYYTTSSCAGRIVLLDRKEAKQESKWLFKRHGPCMPMKSGRHPEAHPVKYGSRWSR
ncbi:hypothetical protein JW968_05915 [Candidatus Woesearchaeota archaeon]|nr:hypothetical protein [Candidatus Woesearchaeota archaeon]